MLICSSRLPQARCLSILLFHSPCILRPSDPHYARRFPYLQIFLQTHFRLCQIPDSYERYERKVPGCNSGGDHSRGHLHHLSGGDAAFPTSRCWKWCGGATCAQSCSGADAAEETPCGHILHFACLRSWLERQQICPTCRRPVVPGPRQGGAIDPPAANAAPGQPIAAVPGQPAADQANQGDPQPGEGQNRFRMLNLGPLRIGFGAGRGDIVNDLAHQINEQARPVQAENQDHARQYGFGFGFGRPRPPPARAGIANIHTQLDTIEQRLQQEISELRMAANELNVVRMLEAELNRLRTLRQTAAGQAVHAPTAPLQAPPSGTSPQVTIRPAQTLVANSQQPILTAGSDALPEGLALPHGWTMMPLHRVDAMGHPPAPGMSTSASSPSNNQTTAAHARGPAAHAVFSPPSAPRPPEGTNNVLTGSPSTPNLNLGQARRRDGALDGSGNSAQSPVSESILTNGDVVLPGCTLGKYRT